MIKKSKTVVLNISISSLLSTDPSVAEYIEDIQSGISNQLSACLGPDIKIAKSDENNSAVDFKITLIIPELAEVPGFKAEFKRSLRNSLIRLMTLGLGPTTIEDRMVRIGVDRDYYRNHLKRYEDSSFFEWGPFEKTAKRRKLQELGYSPFLLSGRYEITAPDKKTKIRDGIFLGWETVKYIKPISPQNLPPSEDQVLKESAKGLAQLLYTECLRP